MDKKQMRKNRLSIVESRISSFDNELRAQEKIIESEKQKLNYIKKEKEKYINEKNALEGIIFPKINVPDNKKEKIPPKKQLRKRA